LISGFIFNVTCTGQRLANSPVADAAAPSCAVCALRQHARRHVSSLVAAVRHFIDWQLNHHPLFLRCVHFDWANM